MSGYQLDEIIMLSDVELSRALHFACTQLGRVPKTQRGYWIEQVYALEEEKEKRDGKADLAEMPESKGLSDE